MERLLLDTATSPLLQGDVPTMCDAAIEYAAALSKLEAHDTSVVVRTAAGHLLGSAHNRFGMHWHQSVQVERG